jgi:hypothetical protein
MTTNEAEGYGSYNPKFIPLFEDDVEKNGLSNNNININKRPVQSSTRNRNEEPDNWTNVLSLILIRSLIPVGAVPVGAEYQKLSVNETKIRIRASLCVQLSFLIALLTSFIVLNPEGTFSELPLTSRVARESLYPPPTRKNSTVSHLDP